MFNKSLFLALISLTPYLKQGVRGDSIILMGLLSYMFIRLVLNFNVYRDSFFSFIKSTYSLCIALFFLVLSSIINSTTGLDASPSTMFARVLMPVVMFFVFFMFLKNLQESLKKVAMAIAFVGFLAAIISIYSVFFDSANFLSHWVSNNEEDSVWVQANSLGRFTGLFNQPLEAGVFFFTSSICSLIICHIKKTFDLKYSIFLCFSIIGGLLSLSKNFSLLGIPLLLFFCLKTRMIGYKKAILIFLPAIILIASYLFIFNNAYLESFITLYSDDGLLSAVSAGRYGSDGADVANSFNDVLNGHLGLGFGLGSKLPLDSGFLEYLYQGGIFSLIGYILFIGRLFIQSVSIKPLLEKNVSFIVCLYMIGASFGGPVITANRANIILILLLSSIVISTKKAIKVS